MQKKIIVTIRAGKDSEINYGSIKDDKEREILKSFFDAVAQAMAKEGSELEDLEIDIGGVANVIRNPLPPPPPPPPIKQRFSLIFRVDKA